MTITLDARPADITIEHPRGSSRTYQFQVVDVSSGLPLPLGGGGVTEIVFMVKVDNERDDDTVFVLKKTLSAGGIALSTGPGAVTAANGWFDVLIDADDTRQARVFPDSFEFHMGAKIYPQKQEVLEGIFEVSGETVWS